MREKNRSLFAIRLNFMIFNSLLFLVCAPWIYLLSLFLFFLFCDFVKKGKHFQAKNLLTVHAINFVSAQLKIEKWKECKNEGKIHSIEGDKFWPMLSLARKRRRCHSQERTQRNIIRKTSKRTSIMWSHKRRINPACETVMQIIFKFTSISVEYTKHAKLFQSSILLLFTPSVLRRFCAWATHFHFFSFSLQ